MRAVMCEMPPRWIEERKNSEASQWDEMWEGVLHMAPAPNGMHQDFESRLYAFLLNVWADPNGNLVFQQRNVSPPDEPDWTLNYRIPDLVLLDPKRFSLDKGSHISGAPLVVVEIRSPRDESYEKLPFFARLGVPEIWILDRDTKDPALYVLGVGPAYTRLAAETDGWIRSPSTGVEFRQVRPGKIRFRMAGDDATAKEVPNR